MGGRIAWIGLSSIYLPLEKSVSDAKVLTGRQKPLEGVQILIAEIADGSGQTGLGFSYSLRAGGGGQYAHAKEIAPILLGEESADIGRLWNKLVWLGASAGRSGIALQAIAALDTALWDLKAKKAELPLSKLIGSFRASVPCYNTSGGYLQAPIGEVLEGAFRSLARGIGGVKIKVGQPDTALDLKRVRALRAHVGDDVPIMVDANQQWDRPAALRMGRILEELNLEWIEEPLDAYDAEGHAELAAQLATPIGTGEMLTSVAEHARLIEKKSVDILMPDAPRVGGITPFLKIAALAEHKLLKIAPHFVMEIHIHLAACFPQETWVEHFEWLEPLFNERLEISAGRMIVPTRPGLGLTLSDRAASWTLERFEAGRRP
ncbi:MAG TPA: enolase [Treponema sp.]|nr:MAG: mandelate racemase/muconate lactonizing protein [Spirochaetes bacterium GWB1_59_5]OHE70196.1 MAG: mandelate racemase/muconate lactonizing protein [Treponema sp. GWC1_61_84]OHE71950.1 MAG: mandelate racemase/muconate lactonizing protein [Treponema sp. RIFOXYC1_FULL_61_9]HCM28423.1 enolase [Treponema sp.]